MLTGDAAVNPDAPIICCTAEVLANIALREGDRADDRPGRHGRVPLLRRARPRLGVAGAAARLPRTQFLLMSATLGDTAFFRRPHPPHRPRHGRWSPPPSARPAALRLGPMTPLHETIEDLLHDQAPVYVVHFTQASRGRARPGPDERQCLHQRGEGAHRRAHRRLPLSAGFGATLSRLVRCTASASTTPGCCPSIAAWSRRLAQAGLLKVICGTDTLGVGINVPIRTVLFTGLPKLRRPAASRRARPGVPPDRRPRRAGRLRHRSPRGGATSSSRPPSTSSRTQARAEEDGTDDAAVEEVTSAEPLDVVGTLATAYRVTDDLQDGFALNQPLSAFALAVLDILDESEPAYALDVVSVIEATLEDPRQVLMAQQFAARGEAVAQMKADGLEYEERLELLDDVTWPKPLADMLIDAFAIYRQSHPWVYEMGLSPKSVVREMYENAMTFGEYVGRYQLGRAEGILLRYLSDAYRALRQTVPLGYRDDELDDLIEWLGELIRQTDSSLVDEWESLINPDDSPHEVRPETSRALSANPRALRVMVRRAIFRRVELLALQRYAALAALDSTLTESQWQTAGEDYFEEYDHLGTGPEARGPAYLQIAEVPGEWTVTQILEDPDGDRDWRLTATLDLAATDKAGEPVFTAMDLAPWE
jgi:hypothetical protein